VDEIVTLEEKLGVVNASERIGETVTKVQPCRVATMAEASTKIIGRCSNRRKSPYRRRRRFAAQRRSFAAAA
jgi:hypothetical protein